MIARAVAVTRAVLDVGFKQAVAYRAELLVWVVATTMPLVMMALFTAVARDAPLGRYGEGEFVAYFLVTFLVRHITGSWAAWEISADIREGRISTKLLHPVHPLAVYALEGLAAIPVRLMLAGPVAVIAIALFARHHLSHDPAMWALFFVCSIAGWSISLLINLAIGCVAFFTGSSARAMDLYFAALIVFSGYVMPIELFPARLRAVVMLLPFRYLLSLPVELLTGRFDDNGAAALQALGMQLAWIAVLGIATSILWRKGVARFGAFGG